MVMEIYSYAQSDLAETVYSVSRKLVLCGSYGLVKQTIHLTRLPSQTTSSRWQVDKEAIGLSKVQQFSHLCVAGLIKYLSILFLNIFTLLALNVTKTFHSSNIIDTKNMYK